MRGLSIIPCILCYSGGLLQNLGNAVIYKDDILIRVYMVQIMQKFEEPLLDNKFKGIRVGNSVEFTYKFLDVSKERSQKVEGLVIAKKHGEGLNGTITLRTILEGYGVERTFPIHSPFVSAVKRMASYKVRRAKLYYLRELSGKAAKLKRIG